MQIAYSAHQRQGTVSSMEQAGRIQKTEGNPIPGFSRNNHAYLLRGWPNISTSHCKNSPSQGGSVAPSPHNTSDWSDGKSCQHFLHQQAQERRASSPHRQTHPEREKYCGGKGWVLEHGLPFTFRQKGIQKRATAVCKSHARVAPARFLRELSVTLVHKGVSDIEKLQSTR